jgi:hypothetical protein
MDPLHAVVVAVDTGLVASAVVDIAVRVVTLVPMVAVASLALVAVARSGLLSVLLWDEE